MILVSDKTTSAGSPQEKEKKPSALRWDPPQVDARVPSLSAVPPCSLPDVLKQTGQRTQEMVDHLQNFIAHEQVRFEQTDRPGMARMSIITGTQQIRSEQTEMSMDAKFDYVVDFGGKTDPLNIRETRTRLAGTDDRHLGSILDKGLPALVLIFHPALQGDYEMRCEGSAQWNNQPAWVVHFRQIKGKRPRTMTMETATEAHPHSPTATELRPLSLKGRAWIAADSGQVMHLETNLAEPILMIDLQELAVSVDYAPVKFQSLDVKLWLPQLAVGYTDYANRRMIIEHSFSDFQLFSIQTQEVTHLKNDSRDLEAKKQLGGMDSPSEHNSSEKLNADSREKTKAPTDAGPDSVPRPRDFRWFPPGVDESVPPVESGPTCNLEEVLQNAGRRIQEFASNLEQFTATESLLQETISKSGGVSGAEKREYDYLVSVQEIRPGIFDLQEHLSGGSVRVDPPGGITTKGLPALVFIFHPYYSDAFSMRCEGLSTLNGKRTWQVYFRQRADKPNRIRAYSTGVSNLSHPVALKGRAWFDAGTYQIVRLQADLIDTLPDIRLTVDHTAIEYGPVHFSSRGVDMWLPQTAELYSDFRGRRIHQRVNYSNYLLFAVDDKQKVSEPKISP